MVSGSAQKHKTTGKQTEKWKGEKMGQIRAFLKEEDGVGVVEIILILVVLISLVLIFKSQLTSLVTSIFGKIVSQSGTV